jgi:ribose/xylose/arabinose/galactoside ABC-type transport system permease subunit
MKTIKSSSSSVAGPIIKAVKQVPVLTYGCIAMLIVFFVFAPNFASRRNISNILQNSSMLMIVSTGMAITIISKQIDVSIGGVMTFSAMMAAMWLERFGSESPFHIVIAFVIGTLVGLCFGIFNGIMIGKYQFNYWLITFATMSMGYGLTQVVKNGHQVTGFSNLFRGVVRKSIFGLSSATWIALLIVLVMTLITLKTRFGRYIFAIGDSEQCALNAGINVVKTRILIYSIAGMLSGFAGVLLLGKTNVADPTVASGYEFDAIAAVIIGGTSFEGGKGSVTGSVVGALIMTAILNGLQLMKVSSYWQQVYMGIFILIIIMIDVLGSRFNAIKQQRRIYK